MKIFDIILTEDRADYIASSMKSRLEAAAQKDLGRPVDAVALVGELKKADPDPQGKNLQFIANMYVKNQFKLEDLARIKNEITTFLKFRKELPIRDLNQIATLDQLYDLTEPLTQRAAAGQEPVSARQQEKEVKKDVVKLIDTPNFKVLIPKSEAASQLYGKGTKWCTAADENCMFDQYAREGDIYIIIANLGGRERKFQLHVQSDQFMNERDQQVGKADIAALSGIPQYTEFVNYLIKKHYGQYLKLAA